MAVAGTSEVTPRAKAGQQFLSMKCQGLVVGKEKYVWQRLCRECRARSQGLNSDRGSASMCYVTWDNSF